MHLKKKYERHITEFLLYFFSYICQPLREAVELSITLQCYTNISTKETVYDLSSKETKDKNKENKEKKEK